MSFGGINLMRLNVLANVAIRNLSIMCISASVEGEFSASRRALGFQRLKMDSER